MYRWNPLQSLLFMHIYNWQNLLIHKHYFLFSQQVEKQDQIKHVHLEDLANSLMTKKKKILSFLFTVLICKTEFHGDKRH